MKNNNIAFDVTNHYSEIYHDFCLIGGIFENNELSPIINKINITNNRYITSILNKYEYTGKIGETLLLHHTIPNTPPQRILIIGCGKQDNLTKENYKKIIHQSIKLLKKTNTKQIIFFLTELNITNCDIYWKIRYAIEIIQDTLYYFTQFKNSTQHKYHYQIENILFYITNPDELENSKKAITDGIIITRNINIAKDLGNMPPNFCNSKYLIQQTEKLTKICNRTTVQILDEKKMKNLGMNAYLSVGRTTNNPPLMSIIKYSGNQHNDKPLILIGKGVTFDSGGLSIKPAEKMDEMKYDMCGAAAVYAALRTAIQLNLPINIIGILATCENMITNSSMRPGNIIKTLSGITVEIKNTDAEGRLILCDALTYSVQFNPKIIIDIATLTGACVIALGHHFTGLMSNCDLLAHELIIASKETDDKIWRLPLHDSFQKQIQSNIADITNTGGNGGGAITAASFLERFVNKHRWAHLDIAGTAWVSNKNKNSATGRPVSMITQFLINHAKQHINK